MSGALSSPPTALALLQPQLSLQPRQDASSTTPTLLLPPLPLLYVPPKDSPAALSSCSNDTFPGAPSLLKIAPLHPPQHPMLLNSTALLYFSSIKSPNLFPCPFSTRMKALGGQDFICFIPLPFPQGLEQCGDTFIGDSWLRNTNSEIFSYNCKIKTELKGRLGGSAG